MIFHNQNVFVQKLWQKGLHKNITIFDKLKKSKNLKKKTNCKSNKLID